MFRRIANLFRGFVSLFVSNVEKANPQALIEAEKENLRQQIGRFNTSLADHAAFVEKLKRQIKKLEKDEGTLAAKITALLKSGHRESAAQLALQIKTVREQLAENRDQLIAADATFEKLVKSRDVAVREATKKIESLKRMISETEMLEAQAELQEMAQGMITSIGGSGDTLDRVQEHLEERRDQAAGRARVAEASLDTTEVDLLEAEQSALADAALNEFAAAYGLDMPETEGAPVAEAPATEVAKDLGPKVSES
ncbi:MAG: PspA/IM30 family protein [Acidobacteriota bacterium]